MSKILQELCAAVKVAVPAGNPESGFIEGVIEKVGKLNDAAWNALSEGAADYFNAAVDAVNLGNAIPALPDFAPPPPAAAPAPGRRRTAAAPAAPAYVVGDEVVVTLKDGTTAAGEVVALDDNGELVLKDAEGELGVELNLIDSVTVKAPPAAAPAPGRRRTAAAPAAAVAEVPEPETPEVGDTVEIVNNRDKAYLGNIVEIDDTQVVITTAGGDELPFVREKIKSIVVKVKNASATPVAPAAPAGRARTRAAAPAAAAAAAPAAGEAPARASGNRGVSVGTRIRELILDNKAITMEQVGAKLKAEGLAFADTSLSMNYKDALAFLKLLADRKMLK